MSFYGYFQVTHNALLSHLLHYLRIIFVRFWRRIRSIFACAGLFFSFLKVELVNFFDDVAMSFCNGKIGKILKRSAYKIYLLLSAFLAAYAHFVCVKKSLDLGLCSVCFPVDYLNVFCYYPSRLKVAFESVVFALFLTYSCIRFVSMYQRFVAVST